MSRLNAFLLAVLLLSSLGLVQATQERRRLNTEIDRAESEEHALDTAYQGLKAERQAQTTPLIVEQRARSQLGMHKATAAVTLEVTDDDRAKPQASKGGSL